MSPTLRDDSARSRRSRLTPSSQAASTSPRFRESRHSRRSSAAAIRGRGEAARNRQHLQTVKRRSPPVPRPSWCLGANARSDGRRSSGSAQDWIWTKSRGRDCSLSYGFLAIGHERTAREPSRPQFDVIGPRTVRAQPSTALAEHVLTTSAVLTLGARWTRSATIGASAARSVSLGRGVVRVNRNNPGPWSPCLGERA
jgi:hypothetical protein